MSKTPEEMAEEFFENWQPEKPKYIRPKARQYALEKVTECFLAGYQAAQQWISVKDRNPAVKTMVLVCHKNFGIQMGYLDENSVKPCRNHWVVYVREHEEWTGNNIPKTGKYEYVNISHWMPLPSVEGLKHED
tara:strand:+ start:4921 stop:5319 length:399 start_codon:yes stop_codon:yes gene_type:complete